MTRRWLAAAGETWVDSADAPAGGIEIRMEGGVTVTGRVLGLTAEERGRRIEVEIAGPGNPALSSVLRPDATFRLDHVPTGFRYIRVHTWKRTGRTARVLEPGTAEVSVDVEMSAAWPVAVQVLDERARPVSGARIEAWEEGNMVVPPGNTRADGRFTLLLPDGHYRIDFKKKGFLPVALELQVDGGPVEGLEARLPLTATLRGRLLGLAPGDPVGIQAQGPGSLPGATALDRYSIEGLPPGLWTIEATVYRSEQYHTVRLPVEIPSGGAVVEMDLDFADAEVEVEPEIEP